MRATRIGVLLALACALLVVPTAPVSAAVPKPGTWSNHRLAAQLILGTVDMSHLDDARRWASHGVGGLVLLGDPPDNLAHKLDRIRAAATIPPLVSSDEEGGLVQRLAPLIYPLHSAEWFGRHRTPGEVKEIARRYAVRMHKLGVDVDLAPVADLAVPGYFIAEQHRSFATRPGKVGRYVVAWTRGMRRANVATTVKHWPGHGHAADSHTGPARTPPLDYLQAHDLKPFKSAFAHNVPIVMVGHLDVPGLTHHHMPATLSRSAYRLLRHQAGPSTLVVTDALWMGAIRAKGYGPAAAAVRALKSGADMAMVQRPGPAIDAVTAALNSGEYSRAKAVASAKRVLSVKQLVGSIADH